jgi:hypothetical protein
MGHVIFQEHCIDIGTKHMHMLGDKSKALTKSFSSSAVPSTEKSARNFVAAMVACKFVLSGGKATIVGLSNQSSR